MARETFVNSRLLASHASCCNRSLAVKVAGLESLRLVKAVADHGLSLRDHFQAFVLHQTLKIALGDPNQQLQTADEKDPYDDDNEEIPLITFDDDDDLTLEDQAARVGRGNRDCKCAESATYLRFSRKPYRTPRHRELENPQIRQKQNVRIPRMSRIFKSKYPQSKPSLPQTKL